MKNRLLWKIGFLYLLMLLLVVFAVDAYVVRAIKKEFLDAAFSQLESLARLAVLNPPQAAEENAIKKWAERFGQSGVRMTVIAEDGRVLADSIEDPATMENHLPRPEIRDALMQGSGRAVRRSPTLGSDLVYLAQSCQSKEGLDLVIRLSLPLNRLEEAQFDFRSRLWVISLLILAVASGASLLFFRTVSNRIGRLKEFSSRVADGDFRPLPLDQNKDELADLSSTMNQTALKLDRTIRTLTEERNQSAAVLASMGEGVAVIGTDQKVLYCNDAFCSAAGIAGMSCQGRPITELIRHSDFLLIIQKALAGGETIHGEVVVGSIRTRSYSVTSAPIRNDGITTGAVMVLHDITEIRRLERARRDFIANISHEFKTPLTAIQGFAETLLGGALEDAGNRRRFLEIIREHALRLGRLTDDLLKLAQIEAGQMQPEIQPVNISAIIDPCMEVGRIKSDQKGLILNAEYGADVPPLFGDLRSFQEILQNLLDNAVRYTPPGGKVLVKAEVDGPEVIVSVSDTGIGIPKADQDRIFERFYRADAARSRESGGTGLGLAIVKHLVEAHGGRIRVESEVGQGSTFYIHFPLEPK
ncbi:MAG: PAS domain-containing protein [Acidobacteria bacterium]|nr:PAS domain-containing protein [Acidobacteriota bacterium]